MFNIVDRVAHCTVAEGLLKSGDGRTVTNARAAVDVVGAQHRAGKFLHHVVGFIPGTARRPGGHNRTRAELGFNAAELPGGVADSLFPGHGSECLSLAVADHRLGQAWGEQAGIVKEIPSVKSFQA